MDATLTELSWRIEKVEQEIRALRNERDELRNAPAALKQPLTLAEQGRLMMERAGRNAAYESRRLGQIFDEMGITGKPMSRKEVQKLYREASFDPEANDFAQGIVAMREE